MSTLDIDIQDLTNAAAPPQPMPSNKRLAQSSILLHFSTPLQPSLLPLLHNPRLRCLFLGGIGLCFGILDASLVISAFLVLLLPLGLFSRRTKVIAEPSLDTCAPCCQQYSSNFPVDSQHTHDTVRTQVMGTLDSSTARALVERRDILEALASHLPVTFLHV
jgi:hypothetical protein